MATTKDKKVPNELPLKTFLPELYIDSLQKAVKEIEGIIFNSGLPYSMDYQPDKDFFMLKLENRTLNIAKDDTNQQTGTWIIDTDEYDHEYRTCSVCDHKELNVFHSGEIPNYCSCCGTRMTTCKI